jgi:hypothetical protein
MGCLGGRREGGSHLGRFGGFGQHAAADDAVGGNGVQALLVKALRQQFGAAAGIVGNHVKLFAQRSQGFKRLAYPGHRAGVSA